MQTLLSAARFGNHLLATGGDVDTAYSRGISVARVKTSAFILSSVLAGFAGIITICDQPQTHVTLGEQMELEAIAAAVLGGAFFPAAEARRSAPGSGRLHLPRSVTNSSVWRAVVWYITFLGIIVIVAVIVNQRLASAIKAI